MFSNFGAIAKLIQFLLGEIKSYLEHERKRKHIAGSDKIKADPAGYFDTYRVQPPTDSPRLPDETDTGPDK